MALPCPNPWLEKWISLINLKASKLPTSGCLECVSGGELQISLNISSIETNVRSCRWAARGKKAKKNKIPLSTKSNWSCSLTFRYVTNIFKGARKVNRHISAACHFLIPNLRYRKYETAAGVVNQTNISVSRLWEVVCRMSKIKLLRLRLYWSPSISLYI